MLKKRCETSTFNSNVDLMAACSFQHRNKWENQKIQKFYVKKHKGVASRQHKFPKLSSNSARPFVRNWAQISKLKCRVQYKNDCNEFCKQIQKCAQSLQCELELVSPNTYSYNINTSDTTHAPSTLHDITLADYIGPNHALMSLHCIINEIEDANDEPLQIAIHQSLQTQETAHTYDINPTATPSNKDDMEELIPSTKHIQMNIKVTIQLHNVLGIDPANLSSKQYTAFPHHHHLVNSSWGPNINSRLGGNYWASRTCMCAYKALPYTLKGCNIEIDINNETRSFCFIPSTDDIYANIPIVFARHHRFRCPYSSEYDNRRLFQIAQKCLENVTRENRFVDPLWKYKKRHYIKDTFVPSVCVLRDLLLDVVPLHVDIINVLIEYLGCAQFECVVIESTVNIPAQYQDILLEDARKKNIQLRCGTKYGVKYLSPFDKDTITLISAKMEYSYEYNWKWQEIKAIEYTKPRTK
eukprot:303331_1